MPGEKAGYFRALSSWGLSDKTINQISEFLGTRGLKTSPIPPEIISNIEYGGKITENLTRLSLSLVKGNKSWEGLLVGFPGNRDDLATKSVGTPYLRMILYPILDLHHRLQAYSGKRLPCIYLVGERFSEVFQRKFELLQEVIPNIIILTHDIFENSKNGCAPPITHMTENHESWTQMKLCQYMNSEEGLLIPLENKTLKAKYLSSEIPCSEGTGNPERLDILGYDVSDHSLIAFELKGQNAGRVELENLFLQGIEHRNWLEKNKMAIKLLFDGGYKGKRINTRKRVRLLLGFYGKKVPHLFNELRNEARRRDPYLEIDFVHLSNADGDVVIDQII